MHYGIGHMGPPPPWKDQLGRTTGRTWKGGPGPPPEGLAGKDLGRRAGVPTSPTHPQKDYWKDLGRRAGVPLPPRTSWEGLLEGPGKEDPAPPLVVSI